MGRFTDLLFARRDAGSETVRLVGFNGDGGLISSGVTGTTMLGLSAVWRCLDILTNGVSQCEWQERRGTLDLPRSRIVSRPHPRMTRRDWTSYVVASMALYDRAYILKTGGEDSEGVPLNLLPLDPTQVQSIASPLNGLQWVSPLPADEYWVGTEKVRGDDPIILNRGPLPGISEASMGLIRLARVKFAEAIAADNYSSRYWQGGGPTDRALETDAVLPDPIAQQISERWRERRSKGPDYVPVLSSGVHYKEFGVDPTNQAAVEARQELVSDVGRFFGIGTSLLNSPNQSSQTYSTTEAEDSQLVRFTLMNYIGAINDAISDQLPGGRRLYIDPAPLYRGTALSMAQMYQLATAGKAWMTPEDVRDQLGLPPVENPEELNPAPEPVAVGEGNGGQGS